MQSRKVFFLFHCNSGHLSICYFGRFLGEVRLNKIEDWIEKGVKRQFKKRAHPPSYLFYLVTHIYIYIIYREVERVTVEK